MSSLLKARRGRQKAIEVTAESAGWSCLDFTGVDLDPGDTYEDASGHRESVVVPMSGREVVRIGTKHAELASAGVFDQLPHVLYVPPGHSVEVPADGNSPSPSAALRLRGVSGYVCSSLPRCAPGCGEAERPTARSPISLPLPCRLSISSSTGVTPRRDPGRDGRSTVTMGTPGRRTWRRCIDSVCNPHGVRAAPKLAEGDGCDEMMACEDGDTALVPRGSYLHPDHTWIDGDRDAGAMTLPTAGVGMAPPR